MDGSKGSTGEHPLTFLDVPPPANARCTRYGQSWETAAEWLATPCVPPGVEPTLSETGATKRKDPYSEFDEAAAMLETIERWAAAKAKAKAKEVNVPGSSLPIAAALLHAWSKQAGVIQT